jgi:hypothetical protein
LVKLLDGTFQIFPWVRGLRLLPKDFLGNQLEQLRVDVERGSPSHTLQVPTWLILWEVTPL